jgi:hypothetical protein
VRARSDGGGSVRRLEPRHREHDHAANRYRPIRDQAGARSEPHPGHQPGARRFADPGLPAFVAPERLARWWGPKGSQAHYEAVRGFAVAANEENLDRLEVELGRA